MLGLTTRTLIVDPNSPVVKIKIFHRVFVLVVSHSLLAVKLLFSTSFSLHSASDKSDIRIKAIDADKQSTIESLSV